MVSETIRIITIVAILIFLTVCVIIGKKTSKKQKNIEEYFLGDKKTNIWLMLGTTWASFAGGGYFVGYCGRGNLEGMGAYWQFLGEGLLAGIVLGYIMAPYLARFKYYSMPHYVADYLCGGDRTVRRFAGFSTLLVNVAWSAAQIIAFATVIATVFNIDYRLTIVVTGAVFIYYTVAGGVEAVIFTDTIQAVIQMMLAIVVILFTFKTLDLVHGFGTLKSMVMSSENPEMWNFMSGSVGMRLSSFMLGFLGIISNSVSWNRAFCADSVKSARISFAFSYTGNIIITFTSCALGVYIGTLVPELELGDNSLAYAVVHLMPPFVTVLMGLGILGATMSTADTYLNCASANIIVDMLDPDGKIPDRKALRYSRIATLICGILGIGSALFTDSIYTIGNMGYVISGGVLVPIFVVGLILRDRKSVEFKSKLKPRAARVAIIVGTVVALISFFVPEKGIFLYGGILPTVGSTFVAIIIGNIVCKSGNTRVDPPKASIVIEKKHEKEKAKVMN